MPSLAEENYLKVIYRLSGAGSRPVLTNEIAEVISTRAASVTDMLKKLAAKNFLTYEKYYGVRLTSTGESVALTIVRKHRLWETFLVNTLHFNWDEVHEVAEQLEHIQSANLIQKLDEHLGFPRVDPHGHPIPDQNGNMLPRECYPLAEGETNITYRVVSVRNGSPSFLQFLSKAGIGIGIPIRILERIEFDGSLEVEVNNVRVFISKEAALNLLVNIYNSN